MSETANEKTGRIEAVRALLHDMGPQKEQLLAILGFCREERTSAEIEAMLEPLRQHRTSVYTGIAMRSLLERAGGLAYLPNDDEVEEVYDEADGSLVLPEPAVATWLTTEAGIACLEAHDPYAELLDALGGASEPAEGLALVLRLCCEGEQTVGTLSEVLRESGVLEGLELDPVAFVSRLEDAGAIEWRGSWIATELGRRYLAQIKA